MVEQLDISWAVFKELITNHPTWTIYVFEHTSMKEVWTGTKDHIFHCDVKDPTNLTELDTYSERSHVVEMHDDAKALMLGTQNIIPLPIGPDGGYITHASHRYVKETFHMKGFSYVATAGALSFFDVHLTDQIYVAGAKFWISPKNDLGDTISMSIVDKDDVLGLFSLYGLTVGVDVLELREFVTDFYAPPEGVYDEIRPDTVSHVIPGLYSRMKYNSVGTEDVPFFINYMWFEFNY